MKPSVLFVAAEAVPLAKTGGLGDVVSALANALHSEGVDVTVLIPGYRSAMHQARGLREVGVLGESPGLQGGARILCGRMPDSEVKVALLEMDWLFDRNGSPYLDEHGIEFPDNAQRFAALCHAAVKIAAGRTRLRVPDAVHVHDWHAGLVPWLMKKQGLTQPVVMTIHNLAFQGVFPKEVAHSIGIEGGHRDDESLEYWGQLSFLKAGIATADRVTTVSETYAEEVLTPHFGHGLDGVLRSRAKDLVPVRNGVDTVVWNPAIDPLIAANYSAANMDGKAICKRALQQQFDLTIDRFAPVLALGSRITTQKMADVALDALTHALERNDRLQVAVLGRGDVPLEEGFTRLAQAWPGRVGVHIGYTEALAHMLHAGADMLLHGSRFEPFGLTPVYAMLYGCVPIVSRVGGLVDTVADSRGILFDGETPADMLDAIEQAIAKFGDAPAWRATQRSGMRADFSWGGPAAAYVELYRNMSAPLAADKGHNAFETAHLSEDQPLPDQVALRPRAKPASRTAKAVSATPRDDLGRIALGG